MAMIRRNNEPLNLQREGRRGRTKKIIYSVWHSVTRNAGSDGTANSLHKKSTFDDYSASRASVLIRFTKRLSRA